MKESALLMMIPPIEWPMKLKRVPGPNSTFLKKPFNSIASRLPRHSIDSSVLPSLAELMNTLHLYLTYRHDLNKAKSCLEA